jgi:TonB family protein
MLRRSLHGDSEKIAIGRGVEKMHRRNTARSSALLLAALIAFSAATPAVAQDSNGSAPPQQSAGAGANGVYKVGGDVSAPVLIHEVKAEFSEKALHANVRGDVLVNIRVDVNGNPSHVHVIRGIGPEGVGLDLDESAAEAVRQYKFKPAMKNGKPVLVELNIEVNIQTR